MTLIARRENDLPNENWLSSKRTGGTDFNEMVFWKGRSGVVRKRS